MAAQVTSINFDSTSLANPNVFLESLPPGALPYSEFVKKFSLGDASTEQPHPRTLHLSQTMHEDLFSGFQLLLEVEKGAVDGLKQFIPTIQELAPRLAAKIQKGGRMFLVGSGTSGRIGVDLAAKCASVFPNEKPTMIAVHAGGASAMIRAREGFEDSEADGEKAIQGYDLTPQDTVILISGSGSASFNVGCGHLAAEQGCEVLYFYNSAAIPDRTKGLFMRERNPVVPLELDMGPQSIRGSTRLLAGTLAEACLGALTVTALYLAKGEEDEADAFSAKLLANLAESYRLVEENLKPIGIFVQIERDVFSDPRSNFRQVRDRTDQGYVTFLATKNIIREVVIDTVETSPTFSTNPPRRESEQLRKRAEFQTYLAEQEKDNIGAWETLLGRKVFPSEEKDVEEFILAFEARGRNAYSERPIGKGNFLIGVAKLLPDQDPPPELLDALACSMKEGGQPGLILLCRSKLKESARKQLEEMNVCGLILEEIPQDPLGISETILAKTILNLISNGSMILMNKVYGNQMIDVRASNGKLIDRSIRIVKEIWREFYPADVLNDQMLYHYILHCNQIKKRYEEEGFYAPSVVKIVLAMLAMNATPADFEGLVRRLAKEGEAIGWIGK